jgi:hypothetical protein
MRRSTKALLGVLILLGAGASIAPVFLEHEVAIPPAPSGVGAASAVGAFAKVGAKSLVPADVYQALVVPSGSQVVGIEDLDCDQGQFDRQVDFRVKLAPGTVSNFFPAELHRRDWKVVSLTTARHGGHEILATHPGSDGYTWEVGVVVATTAARSGWAGFSMELFQVQDSD